MPEIQPDHVPSPRTLLAWDGTAYRPIHIDALGNVQTDVVASALPAGAATEARLVITNTLLTQIATLRMAPQSLAGDRLIVRGEDQLFSFRGVLAEERTAVVSGASGSSDSDPCPAGQIWHVTNIVAWDATSPTTQHLYYLRHDGVNYIFHREVAAFAAGGLSQFHDDVWLDPSDTIRVKFVGSQVGDSCTATLTGCEMTLET